MAESLTYLNNSALTSSGSLSGSVSFGGLGSDTDFKEVVDQLVALESINKERLETWRATWEAKSQAIAALNLRLESVGQGAEAMDSEKEFLVRSASTSDSTKASAAASSSAAVGAYSLEIASNAKHILNSQGVGDADSTACGGAGGDLVLSVNGTTYSIAINAGDTLNDIQDKINASGAPVTAEVINDRTTSNPYRLELTSDTGGADYRIEVTQNPTDLNLNVSGITLQDDTAWNAVADIDVVGQFTGENDQSGNMDVWTYTITNSTGSQQTVGGASSFDLNWESKDKSGATISSGTITVPADYNAGDSLALDEGLSIQLSAGTIENGANVTYRAHANDFDDAELTDWDSQPNVTVQGNYLGSVSQTYTFTVTTGATIQDGGGAGTAVLRWTNSSGKTGTVSISDSLEAYEVDSGIKIQIDAGTLQDGKDFQVNVFGPDKQQGQDSGLAQVAKVVHSGFADESSTAVTSTAGTFSYTYGGTETSVSVSTDTNLAQLAALINADPDNPGVTASIVNDGLGLPTSYRFMLTGRNPGAQYQITNVTHDFTGNFGTGGDLGGGFTTNQMATNSMIKVDGFPAEEDIYLQRSSNSVGDVIEGVNLDLHDRGTTQVTVNYDVSAIVSKVEAFINSVNYAQDYIRLQTQYDPDGEDTGVLIGNYGFYTLKTRIDSILYTPSSGLDSSEDTYTLLAQVGIESNPDNDGAWEIDTAVLRNALSTDAEAVANLFVANTDKGTIGVASAMAAEMAIQTDSETGMGPILIENYADIMSNIDKKIEREENRIELFRQRQIERFARLDSTLAELSAMQESLESQIDQLPNK